MAQAPRQVPIGSGQEGRRGGPPTGRGRPPTGRGKQGEREERAASRGSSSRPVVGSRPGEGAGSQPPTGLGASVEAACGKGRGRATARVPDGREDGARGRSCSAQPFDRLRVSGMGRWEAQRSCSAQPFDPDGQGASPTRRPAGAGHRLVGAGRRQVGAGRVSGKSGRRPGVRVRGR